MQDKESKIIVISGLSGAGKSVALQSLEDIGYYCIDNMPLSLLPEFARQLKQGRPQQRAAVSIDSRNLDFLEVLKQGENTGDDPLGMIDQLIYVEASADTLLRRYSETRRKHPLSNLATTLVQSIEQERILLSRLKDRANHVVDSSALTPHELREKMRQIVGRSKQGVMLSIESFGFKHGPPLHADYIFDVRCLPNPYWDASLREYSGLDAPVIQFLEAQAEVGEMCEDIAGFIEKWLPSFEADNRAYLTLAIGCTGGRHRSVYAAAWLADWFARRISNVQVMHRDL